MSNKVFITLLEELWKNSHAKIQDLAEIIGKTRQTTSEYKKKLWNNGIIHSPTILINPHSLNLQTFFMEIKTNPSEPLILRTFTSPKFQPITMIDGILGDYSLMLKIVVPSKMDFAELLNQFDQHIAEKSRFHSYRIIETLDIYKLGGFPLYHPSTIETLDDKRWKILKILEKNHNPKKWPIRNDILCQIKEEELRLLNKINLSREIKKFERAHILDRFTIKLGSFQGELKTKFYVRIKPTNLRKYQTVAEELVKNPNIIELYRTGEEAGLLAIVRTKSIKDFNLFIQKLYQKYAIIDSHSTVVVEEKIPSIYPPTIKVAKAPSSQFPLSK